MPTSINGWPVLDNPAWGDARLRKGTVPGVAKTLWCRDEVWPLFAALVRDYHETIRPVRICDAYDYRKANAADAWSDHSAGAAVDLNYDAEGAQGTGVIDWWRKGKRYVKAARIKRRYRIVIWGGPKADVWGFDLPDNLKPYGGDYSRLVDAMHWALKPGTTVADVKRECKRLRIGPDGIRRRRNGSPVHPAA